MYLAVRNDVDNVNVSCKTSCIFTSRNLAKVEGRIRNEHGLAAEAGRERLGKLVGDGFIRSGRVETDEYDGERRVAGVAIVDERSGETIEETLWLTEELKDDGRFQLLRIHCDACLFGNEPNVTVLGSCDSLCDADSALRGAYEHEWASGTSNGGYHWDDDHCWLEDHVATCTFETWDEVVYLVVVDTEQGTTGIGWELEW